MKRILLFILLMLLLVPFIAYAQQKDEQAKMLNRELINDPDYVASLKTRGNAAFGEAATYRGVDALEVIQAQQSSAYTDQALSDEVIALVLEEREDRTLQDIQLNNLQKDYLYAGMMFQAAALSKNQVVVSNLEQYQEKVKGMNMLAKRREASKSKGATRMSQALSGTISSQKARLKMLVEIAKNNGISIPDEVRILQ